MEFSELLKTLETDIRFYNDSIKEVAFEILDNSISEFPVFIVHKNSIKLGEIILNKDDFSREWSVNASILEELVEKKIISVDKSDSFKKVYKDPRKNICIFLVTEEYANFVFIPFKTIKSKKDPINN